MPACTDIQVPGKIFQTIRRFAEYFSEREKRLSTLSEGYVVFHITVEQNQGSRSMQIRIEDSGTGFEYDNQLTDKPIDNLSFSGRGILLIRDLCESLEYMGRGNIAVAVYSWKSS